MIVLYTRAQDIRLFQANHKWGYKTGQEVLITPQYDTAFPFDKTGQVAMVGNINKLKTLVNPLTGEEKQVVDYYFITKHNLKIRLKSAQFPDSMFTFPDQQELKGNYLNTSATFKILFQDKVWLFTKRGKQLSEGFDDIFPATDKRFYITEIYTEQDHDIIRAKGLIDTNGRTIVTSEKKHIHINREDSVIYACSALFNKRLSDEVFDYNGKMIYSNKNHIEFASKMVYVYKLYDPKEVYMIENPISKEVYGVEGEHFYCLKQNKALIVNQENWLLLNLQTGKKQKVNKDSFYQTAYKLTEFECPY